MSHSLGTASADGMRQSPIELMMIHSLFSSGSFLNVIFSLSFSFCFPAVSSSTNVDTGTGFSFSFTF